MGEQSRVAIVTGGSRGIGRAIALALAGEGFDVVVNYARNADAAGEVAAKVRSLGRRALTVRADVSSAADRAALVHQTVASFGHIDLLVNNAGVAPDVRADLLEASEESFDRLININLKGPYFLTQLVARRMVEQQKASGATGSGVRVPGSGIGNEPSGADAPNTTPFDIRNSKLGIPTTPPPPGDLRPPTPNLGTRNPEPGTRNPEPAPKIVNITSVSAYAASVNRGDYCVAKAGLAMMTQLFAARLAEHGINVYEIRPGIIETDMTGPVKEKYDELIFERDLTPIRRWGRPDDVALAVVAVARDLLPFSTGQVIDVDGGFHLRRL